MAEGKGAYKAALGVADTGGGVLSLLNPEGVDLIITRLVLDVTTKATAACTLDAGVAAAATTSNDTLINGIDVNAAAGVFGNIDDKAGNGQAVIRWESDYYLTISMASGAAAGLVGNAYIEYIRV